MKPARSSKQPPALPARSQDGNPVVELVVARAGSPTPTERQQVYLTLLRKGDPPPGWIARQAKAWGITHPVVSGELQEARAELAASRTPDAAQLLAHEQVQQSIEAADKIERLSDLLDDPADQIKAIETSAKLRQNAAKTLQAIYKKPGALLLGHVAQSADVGASLKGPR